MVAGNPVLRISCDRALNPDNRSMSVLAIVALTAAVLIALAAAARVALRRRRRRRLADPLGANWWPEFEEAFRHYATGHSYRRPRETEQ